MQTLFEQIGLPSKHEHIEKASFIVESIQEDSDWIVLVDQLDLQLHQ